MWRRAVWVVVSSAMVFSLATAARAQAPGVWDPASGAAPPWANLDPAARAKLRQQLRANVEQRLAKFLDLDEATASSFFAIANKYNAQVEALQQQAVAARRQLKQLIDSGGGDDATIQELTEQLLSRQAALEQLKAERIDEVRQVLTPAQFGKLMLAWPRIQQRIRAEVARSVTGRR